MSILDFFRPGKKQTGPSDDARRVMIQSMAAMAAADGDLGEEEIRKMDAIYARLTGREIGESAVAQVTGPFLDNKVAISTVLKNERDDLSDSDKALVLKASYLVLMADNVMGAEEEAKLGEITSGLGLSGADLDAILKDLKSEDWS